MTASRETIRHAKELNQRIHVLGRAQYLRDVPVLRNAGAEAMVSAEGEVALALTDMMLHRLGAAPD
jgi:CPA2 family monovalent cation:H+ antiporter-2